MAYTATIRVWWEDYFKQGYDRRISMLGRPGVKATDFTFDAWSALEQTLVAFDYGDAAIISTYYPRYISGTTKWSLHSYSGVALDIDPVQNPYKKGTSWDFSLCRFTRPQVDAVLAIRTMNGKRVWRWGGDFGDYMHWQLDCRPEDLALGIDWSTVPSDGIVPEGDDQVLKNGDSGKAVGDFQRALLRFDSGLLPLWGADEDWGDETDTACRIFQAANDLVETGVLDTATVFAVTPFQAESWNVIVDPGYAELEDQVNLIEASLADTQEKLRSV